LPADAAATAEPTRSVGIDCDQTQAEQRNQCHYRVFHISSCRELAGILL
jgi:hypothetical protein